MRTGPRQAYGDRVLMIGRLRTGFEVRPISVFDGGRTRARTWDPLIKSQLLYQLSYAPIERLPTDL